MGLIRKVSKMSGSTRERGEEKNFSFSLAFPPFYSHFFLLLSGMPMQKVLLKTRIRSLLLSRKGPLAAVQENISSPSQSGDCFTRSRKVSPPLTRAFFQCELSSANFPVSIPRLVFPNHAIESRASIRERESMIMSDGMKFLAISFYLSNFGAGGNW